MEKNENCMENASGSPTPISKHPFEIAEILDKIFGYLTDFEDVKRFRGVKRFWREVSLEKWRGSTVLRITLELINRFYEEENRIFENEMFEISTEEYVLFRLSEHPFQHYRIPFYHMSFPPNRSRKQETFFYQRVASHMKYLDMGECWFKRNRILEGLHWILLKYCVNLEELKMMPYQRSHNPNLNLIANGGFQDESDEEDTEDIFQDFKDDGTAAKMKTLTISSSLASTESAVAGGQLEFEELFDNRILAARFLSWLPNLQNLIVTATTSSPIFMEALSRPLNGKFLCHLEKLTIMLNSGYFLVPLSALHAYLEGGAPPLRELKLEACFPKGNEEELFQEVMGAISGTVETLDVTFDRSVTRWRNDVANGNIIEHHYFQMAFITTVFSHLLKLNLQFNFDDFNSGAIPVFFSPVTLRKMPVIKEFRFEMRGSGHLKNFISSNALDVADMVIPVGVEELGRVKVELNHLEEFHFCGKFSADMLNILGMHWMKNVKCFEAVFDEGIVTELVRFLTVAELFPHLEKLIVHPYSRLDVEHNSLQELKAALLPHVEIQWGNDASAN